MTKKVARRTRIQQPAAQTDGAADDDGGTNEAPYIEPIETQTAHPTVELLVYVLAWDPEGDPITFSLVSGPATASIDAATGEITWTPAWSDVGSHYITVRATDDHSNQTDATFQVNVTNAKPEVAPQNAETGHPGEEILFYVLAFDPDGDTLTYSLVNPPTGASIDANSGLFSWVPDWSQLGSRYITARVCDPEPLCTDLQCQVHVVNSAPEIAPIADQIVDAESEMCVSTLAFDPDGDALTYELVSAPTGVAIDGAGDICWTPTAGQVGVHFITVRVKDPEPLSAQTTFKVTVVAP